MSQCNCFSRGLLEHDCHLLNPIHGGCYGKFDTNTLPTFAEIQNFKNKVSLDVESLRRLVNAQQHTINHTQDTLEAYLLWLEKIDPPIRKPSGIPYNPFEYIAVDAKRRDDMSYIKNSLYELYCFIINNIQDNKERSKGIERLEEAAMWLNKSISRRKDNETRNDRQPKSKG